MPNRLIYHAEYYAKYPKYPRQIHQNMRSKTCQFFFLKICMPGAPALPWDTKLIHKSVYLILR